VVLAAVRRAIPADWISLNNIGPDPESPSMPSGHGDSTTASGVEEQSACEPEPSAWSRRRLGETDVTDPVRGCRNIGAVWRV
jgi:hypothetical protein